MNHPLRVELNPIHGASILDAKGSRIVADVYDEEHAASIVKECNAHDPLVAALTKAKETIRAFNGMGMKGNAEQMCWDAYQHSPEMKEINAALAMAEGEQVQPVG